MNLFKLISNLKNYIYFFLMLFFFSNLFVSKADGNKSLIIDMHKVNILNEIYSHDETKYSEYDKANNQLKLFFGFDPENPDTYFYPDLLIIDYSEDVRDMYKLKLNDLTTIK